MEFTGIQPDSIWLLAENRFQNSKSFYEEKKPEIRKGLIEPLSALIRDLAPTALKIDPKMCVVPSRCLSRVRRDTRFTKDKTLYRESMWFLLRRPKDGHKPHAFYWFEVAPRGYQYGSGIWGATPATMAAWRRQIDEKPASFLRAVSPVLQGGYEVSDERYRRPKKEDLPAKIAFWYNLKEVYASCPWKPVEGLLDAAAVENEMCCAMEQLTPFYRMLCKVVEWEQTALEREE